MIVIGFFFLVPIITKAQVAPDPIPDPTPTCATDPTLCPPTDPVVPTETVLIRNGDTIIYQGTVALPAAGSIAIADATGATHSVNSDSVLGVLYTLDQTSDSFSLSNLQYFSSMNAFYLKCLTGGGNESCDNWQYVVGGTTPWQSIDQAILTGGETIGIYFGSPYKVVLNNANINTNDTVSVISQKYNYENNSWNPRGGVTVGITQSDPSNPWTPIEIQTSLVDVNGVATFSNISAGSYAVGIKEDYYFPTEALTVIPFITGGGSITPIANFNVPNAVSYLMSTQSSDGSFGANDMYTDWASIALVASSASDSVIEHIVNYMSAHNSVSPHVTDNERHAIALMALHQNPYSFNGVDFISPIANSFDGVQFGDSTMISDDVFGLISLYGAGYTTDDQLIQKDIAYIISKQQSNGSWENSIDMTAATVQALSLFSFSDKATILGKADTYLHSMQQSDGGFGNVYSSSWAMQAIKTSGTSWDINTMQNYFSIQQNLDGGVLLPTDTIQNRIWATSYAIPAVLGMSWGNIMHSVSKPVIPPVISEKKVVEKKEDILPRHIDKDDKIILSNTKDLVHSTGKVALVEIQEKKDVSQPVAPIVHDTQTLVASANQSHIPIPVTLVVASLFFGFGLIYVVKYFIK